MISTSQFLSTPRDLWDYKFQYLISTSRFLILQESPELLNCKISLQHHDFWLLPWDPWDCKFRNLISTSRYLITPRELWDTQFQNLISTWWFLNIQDSPEILNCKISFRHHNFWLLQESSEIVNFKLDIYITISDNPKKALRFSITKFDFYIIWNLDFLSSLGVIRNCDVEI